MLPGTPFAPKAFAFLTQFSQTSHLKRHTSAAMLFFLAVILLPVVSRSATGTAPGQVARSLPLGFEENHGQAERAFRYVLRYNGSEAMFSPGSVDFRPAGLRLQGGSVRMRMLGTDVSPEGQDLLEGQSNYLIGADSKKWIRNIPHFRQIEYDQLYPGISLAFYGNGDALEHDFQLAPGADPSQILFRFEGAESVSISADGDLEVRAAGQTLLLCKPLAYQTTASGRTDVEAGFSLRRDGAIGFRVGAYNLARPLVIDPVFVFSSYLGGTGGDTAAAVTTDASGNIYLTGYTSSTDFPTANPEQPYMGGCDPYAGCLNVFITKLNPSGTALIYSTYLGGSSQDSGSSIVVDGSGDAIVAGFATSSDFPKAGAIQSPNCQINNSCFFLASLTPDGSALNYSGMIGGSGPNVNGDVGHVAVDSSGNAYLTGYTEDPSFQITAGTLATSVVGDGNPELFVLKVDSTGKLIYSTVVPGNATQGSTFNNNQFIPMGTAVDASGQVTVAGFAGLGLPTTSGVVQATFPNNTTNVQEPTAGFVLQINATASAVNFASYLPGTDNASAMTVDSKGNLYFAGWTGETDLPTNANAYQKTVLPPTNGDASSGYVLELTSGASAAVAATYLNGTTAGYWEFTSLTAIELDSKGNIFVGGETGAPDFPLQDPFTTVHESSGTVADMVLAEVDPTMSTLLFGSFLDSTDAGYGGSGFSGIAIDRSDNLIVAGTTFSRDFPTTASSFEPELPPVAETGTTYLHTFIAKIDMATPAPSACLPTASISFGSAVVGASTTQTLNVTNCGNAPMNLSSIVLSSPTVVPSANCGAVAAGSVCPVTLRFSPVANGSVSGTITITDNAVLPPPIVAFSGTGQAPEISVQPSSVVFPAQVFGVSASGASTYVFVRNVGAEPLVINLANTTASGDFSIASDGCTSPLDQYNSCLIQISFTPTQVGQRTGTLNIASNDPSNPVLAVPLTGTAVAAYPLPTISQLISPTYPVTSGTTPIAAAVGGTNFFPSSVVYANGVAQPTTYQDSTSLAFTLNPILLNAMGEIPITVVNPAPGGGSSAPFPLIAYLSVPLAASALAVDPVGGLLYTAIPASATQNPSTVIPINPATGAMMTPIAVSSDPQLLAVSDDGSELYVGTSTGVLQRINLKTLAIERTFNLPVDAEWGQTYSHEMHVVPGSPQSIVVELFAHVDPAEDGAALYNDSGLVNWLPGVTARPPLTLDSFTFTSPTTIYGLPEGNTFFAELQVSVTGLSVISQGGAGCCNETTGSTVASDGTLLYTNSGEVWNPTTQTLLGTFLEPTGSQPFYIGRPVPDTANNHTYFLDTSSEAFNIDIYNQTNFGLASTISFPNVNFVGATDLVRWGSNGLAFRSYDNSQPTSSADQIVILTSSKVNSAGDAPVPILSSVSPTTAYAAGPAYTLQVNGSGFTTSSTVLIGGNARTTTFLSATLLTVQVLASDIANAGEVDVQVTTPGPGGGTSNQAALSINIQTPTVTATPSPINVTTAQTTTVTVSVSGASGYPTPTGTVALSSSIYSSEAVTLSGGSATISLPAGSLVIGTDTFTVSYTPDSAGYSIYKNATGSGTVSVGVPTKIKPTVSVTPSANSATSAQALTVTVVVSGGSGNPTPTGSLTVTIGGSILAEPYLTGGTGTINIAAGQLPVGSDTLTANYTPDSTSSATYNNATGTATLVVTAPAKVTPTVSVTPSATSINSTQALIVSVTVSGGSSSPTPTGSVTLFGGGFTSAATALGSGGVTFSIPAGSLTAGTDTLTASYTPDSASSSTYNITTGAATVVATAPAKITPTVSVTPSATSITTAQALTVTVAVSGSSGNPTPTGSVTLSGGGFTSASTALGSGSATVSIPAGSLTAGTDTLTASYTPDSTSSSTYNSATGSVTLTVTTPIGTAVSTVAVTPSATTITNDQAITVKVNVSGASGQATPAGNVTLASGSYSAQQMLSNGAASFDIAAGTLSNGASTLTANYGGDGNYSIASATTTITVTEVTIAVSAPPSVSPGGSASATATLAAGSNYSGTMNLLCTLTTSPTGAQSLPTCSLNPASAALAAGGNATTTLTIDTTAASSSALALPLGRNLWGIGGGGAVLAVVLILWVPSGRRRFTSMLILLSVAVGGCVTGCGGGGGGHTTGPGTAATTAGSYTFTVTGKDSANAGTTVSANFVVVVQ